jgi:hypothetical protein
MAQFEIQKERPSEEGLFCLTFFRRFRSYLSSNSRIRFAPSFCLRFLFGSVGMPKVMNGDFQLPLVVSDFLRSNFFGKHPRFHELVPDNRNGLPVLVLFDECAMSLKNPD